MNNSTWMVTGGLAALAIAGGVGAAVADSTNERELSRMTIGTGSSPAAVSGFDATNPGSALTAGDDLSAQTSQTAVSAASAQSAQTTASAPSAQSPQSPASPASADSAVSAESAASAD